ncbi:TPA: ketopantoate reductase family protein [Clostridioides difficile]|nr:ketopantoate reductase family protein [Clostridioides difficile]HDO9659167.1 ketopantoate reductase family protein [Clostridioides difficile]
MKNQLNENHKKVVFFGVGAVGSTFAEQFFNSKYDFKILCDNERKKRYLEEGFIINGKRYDFDYVTKDEYKQEADFIIIGLKYNNLKENIKELDGLVGKNTVIMSLLNGVDSEEIIGERFGIEKMVYSYVTNIDAKKINNNIIHTTNGVIVFGNKDNSEDRKTNIITEVFDDVNIEYILSKDIQRDMWWKYMVNIGVNQTSAILGAPYGVFQSSEHLRELAKSAMREVVAIAQAKDISLTEDDVENSLHRILEHSKEGRTSMLQDVEAHRLTEVDMFSKNICKLGKKYNIPTPINQTFFYMIKVIESRF